MAYHFTAAGTRHLYWLKAASAQIDFLMGEAHLARRDNEKAKASFRKAIEKQPNHQQAGRRLKELGG